jgi:hypothetical protein
VIKISNKTNWIEIYSAKIKNKIKMAKIELIIVMKKYKIDLGSGKPNNKPNTIKRNRKWQDC